jgi:hypothetical protein
MMAINSWLAGGKQQRRLERSAGEVKTFDLLGGILGTTHSSQSDI